MKKLLFIFFLFLSLISKSQNFEYQVLFEGIGDNREFSSEYAMPQTILGSRGAFELGVEMDGHRLLGGLSYLYEFGTDINFHQPKLTLYYQFNNDKTEFAFGAFPRVGKIDFPLLMLTDTLLYYRPNIEGFFGQTNWNWGHQNGFIDWIGRQTETQREQFMAGFSGEISYKNLFFQNYLLLFHNAHTTLDIPKNHIKDYMGFTLQGGIRTSETSKLKGHVKAGVLESSYRERGITDGFINAISFFAEVQGKYKNVGIKSVINSGAGHYFAYGDPYSRAKNYLRTDAIWYFINHEKVKGKFNYSFHLINWKTLDQQQQLSIVYIFGK